MLTYDWSRQTAGCRSVVSVCGTPIRKAASIVDQLTGPSNQFCRSPPEASVLMTDSHQARIALRKQIPWALSAYTPASVAVSPTVVSISRIAPLDRMQATMLQTQR